MRHTLFAALLVALLTTPCLAAEAEPEVKAEVKPDAATQKVLDQIAKLTADVKSFSAEFTMPMPAQQGARPMSLKGAFTFMLPESIKMTATAMFGIQTVTISDGKTTWVQMPALGVIAKVDQTAVKKALEEHGVPAQKPQHNIAAPLTMITAGTAKLVGSEKAGDIECWVFEGAPAAAAKAPTAPAGLRKLRVLVAKKDGLARRIAYTDATGKALGEILYSNVKVNVKADASTFAYTPPEGAKVIDQTQQAIMMIKSMIPKKK